ncbi:MAG: hypothetical protein CL433_10420 [Acidimicrobiaceae bacterium]|nr:hypothetical protein [Acidimicrobiaceae bacterium]HAB57841.1 hypothetical protein [Acidimicrobiaceae bacterium]
MDVELAALIEEHLPFVKNVVFQVAVQFPRHVDRDELARTGALGLVEAARRYDEARGVPVERVRCAAHSRRHPRCRLGCPIRTNARSLANSRRPSSTSLRSWVECPTTMKWSRLST